MLPHTCGLPQLTGGSASALELSRLPGLHLVTAHRIAQRPKAAFVAGLRPSQLPGRAACQLPDQSTIIRVRPSLTGSSRPQTRRFSHKLATSGLARSADILRVIRHVSKVPPEADVAFSTERHSRHEPGPEGVELAVSITSIRLKRSPTAHDTGSVRQAIQRWSAYAAQASV